MIDIKKIGITFSVNEDFEDYSISGEIQKYENDTFFGRFQVMEENMRVIESVYSQEYNITYIANDLQKISQYQQILLTFMLDSINEIKSQEQ